MGQRYTSLFAALSLLMFLGTAALWVRNLSQEKRLAFGSTSRRVCIASGNGSLLLELLSEPQGGAATLVGPFATSPRDILMDFRAPDLHVYRFLGLRIDRGSLLLRPGRLSPFREPRRFTVASVAIPYIHLLTITFLATTFFIWRWRRARKPPPGHCRGCGYNLAGNTSGACPECGKPAAR